MSTSKNTTPNYASSASNEEAVADKAKEYANEAVDKGVEYAEQAQDMAVEKLGDFERAIRRNPLQAAAIAAGIGFVFALIARR